MDSQLSITEKQREGVLDSIADQPLTAIAWQILRGASQRETAIQSRQTAALKEIAQEVFRLRKIGTLLSAAEKDSGPHLTELLEIAAHLETALPELGLLLIAPVGAPYCGQLLEIIENIAQIPSGDGPGAIHAPLIAEIIEPAILYRGALLQMGKAIIAIPPAEIAVEG